MKQILTIIMPFIIAGALTINAQEKVHSDNARKKPGFEFGIKKKYTHEIDLYIANSWGVGYQLRREFNPYVGWNAFGISYLSRFCNPADTGIVYLRIAGVRGHTPSAKWFRGYLDLSLGYYFYIYGDYNDGRRKEFCMDISEGFQVNKKISIGYNLGFIPPKHIISCRARIAILF